MVVIFSLRLFHAIAIDRCIKLHYTISCDFNVVVTRVHVGLRCAASPSCLRLINVFVFARVRSPAAHRPSVRGLTMTQQGPVHAGRIRAATSSRDEVHLSVSALLVSQRGPACGPSRIQEPVPADVRQNALVQPRCCAPRQFNFAAIHDRNDAWRAAEFIIRCDDDSRNPSPLTSRVRSRRSRQTDA